MTEKICKTCPEDSLLDPELEERAAHARGDISELNAVLDEILSRRSQLRILELVDERERWWKRCGKAELQGKPCPGRRRRTRGGRIRASR